VLCAPEFNHSIPGVLKNALDWASRPPSPRYGLNGRIMATSRERSAALGCLSICVWRSTRCCRASFWRASDITSTADKIRDGRLVDETRSALACAAIEALLREIRYGRSRTSCGLHSRRIWRPAFR